MRIALTSLLLAVAAAGTAWSITALPYYDDKSGALLPLVYVTAGLWIVFGLSIVALRAVRTRAAVVLILIGSVAIGGAAMAGPPNTSTDSARYAWDGIVQNAGISPYDHAPADPALADLRPEWLFPTPVVKSNGELGCTGPRIMTVKEPKTGDVLCTAINRAKVTTIYPPASEIFFAAVRFVTGPTPQYWPMQLAGLIMSLTTTVLLLRALVARGRDPRWAALWGWCPLIATEGVTNSHVDILGAMFVFIATLLVSTRRPTLGGIALGIAISSKLIPVIGSFALLKRNPFKVILGSIAVFALLYVPYILASGIDVLGYLPGYLSEEGYTSGTRFIMISLVAPGAAALVVAGILILMTAALTWWKSNPDDPWLAQLVMIGVTLLIVTPRYPWYALMLVPMIAMTGRWEWLAVPLALTERLLIPSVDLARLTVTLAIILIVAMTLHRAGPGALSRLGKQIRHPFGGAKTAELRGFHSEFVTER
ncbi:glycosyltransferase family 87 protein [Salinibacterium sp. G-O1]|uniref:glycosyltransferase family 87 protein n=1 Tax=Salinibacterium sp. G-O1 TaxID=3046208 RepID=UPI0024BA8235|nr:glycosyltransferase family 87 protein [Salinibacterium sp. G-O1]MDJ0335924.1 glycosyltransferase family 87 protein [Salinibacterium sp. G-O1]